MSVVVVGKDVVDGFDGGENDDDAFEVHLISFQVEGAERLELCGRGTGRPVLRNVALRG